MKELEYIGSPHECECFGAYFNFGKDIFTDSLDNTEVGMNEYLRVPLYLAQKWLREEKEVYVIVIPEYNDYRPVKGVKYRLEVAHWRDDKFGYETMKWKDEDYTVSCFDDYEEALAEGVRASIKILEDEQKKS